MTALAWALIVLALLLGGLLGRLSKRRPVEATPPTDPRLEFHRTRADGAEKKIAAQEGELREWAASHKALEAQVADVQRHAAEARQAAEAEPSPDADVLSTDGLPSEPDAAVASLEAVITRLEGQIAAGAGSVSQADAITSAQQMERVAVLEVALGQSKRKIAELERRLDS